MSFVQMFSDYIRNIAIFIIFTTFVGIAVPNSKYKDYINLTLGFVLIFIVLSPLQSLFGCFAEPIDEIIDGLTGKVNSAVISKEAAYYSDAQKQLVLNEYKAQLQEGVKARINAEPGFEYVSSEISVRESDEGFGELLSVSVVVREKTAEATQKPFIRIEPAVVETISVFSPATAQSEDDGGDEAALGIKKIISDFYNLPDNNIYITVIGS